MTEIYINYAIFIPTYWVISYFFIIHWKRLHKFFLYIALPFLINSILHLLYGLYFQFQIISDPILIIYSHFFTGIWLIGAFSWLIYIFMLHFYKQHLART